MKTIEERVQRYCADECPNASKEVMTLVCRSFKDGAKSEHAELTRWNDPKEIVPNHRWAVLVKITTRIYDVASYSTEMGRWIIENYSLGRDEIVGWREIHG